MIRKFKIIFIALLFICVSVHKGYAQKDKSLYSKAVKAARAGDIDFAFINFHVFLETFPESRLAENALFAQGEYYFLTANSHDATVTFSRFIDHYPESKAHLFALAYLLETARKEGNNNLVKKLEKEIITSQQIVLLFRESKECHYVSAFSKKYKAAYFIDRVEFHIDEEFFTKVSF